MRHAVQHRCGCMADVRLKCFWSAVPHRCLRSIISARRAGRIPWCQCHHSGGSPSTLAARAAMAVAPLLAVRQAPPPRFRAKGMAPLRVMWLFRAPQLPRRATLASHLRLRQPRSRLRHRTSNHRHRCLAGHRDRSRQRHRHRVLGHRHRKPNGPGHRHWILAALRGFVHRALLRR